MWIGFDLFRLDKIKVNKMMWHETINWIDWEASGALDGLANLSPGLVQLFIRVEAFRLIHTACNTKRSSTSPSLLVYLLSDCQTVCDHAVKLILCVFRVTCITTWAPCSVSVGCLWSFPLGLPTSVIYQWSYRNPSNVCDALGSHMYFQHTVARTRTLRHTH